MRAPGLDPLGGLGEDTSHLSKAMGKMLRRHLLPIPAPLGTTAAPTPLQHLFKEGGQVLCPLRGAAKCRISA